MEKFSDIDSWVFDLDNTLYPAKHNLFAQVDKRMTAFIQDALSVSREEAYRLQKDYLRDYGTTLAGLMNRHNMMPDAFLDFVHDIDVSVLSPDPTLRDMIDALPGRRFIFTNGTRDHATRVATRLGICDLFHD
ncbi:MAG: pyrimidine 5'-nucleotidase, partial [Pseudomonadota bacterium]|nr:pyrimidine 5'-nucleotidase [Pseudomonadota bacterium]